MRILILGSGGREHALALKFKEDNIENEIFTSPGNAGTSEIGSNILLTNFIEIKDFCLNKSIDFVVVGAEQFLSDGITDFLESYGISVFGPSKEAAKLESSKVFAKNLMKKYEIPTAQYLVFNRHQKSEAIDFIKNSKYPLVIKASGLAAGKGVLICNYEEEAIEAIKNIFDDDFFGESGNEIVIEEFLEGKELSIFAISDGKDYFTLPLAKDYKRIFDNDEGKNTGGMGAITPVPFVNEKLFEEVKNSIIENTFNALNAENIFYKGCLYFGIMISKNKPYVIEYNVRFGDPEIQAVLQLIEGDFSNLLLSASEGKLDKQSISFKNGYAMIVIISSGGYPDNYQKDFKIEGLNSVDENIKVIHAGTKIINDEYQTSGGRVLGLLNYSENSLNNCSDAIYKNINKIYFKGMHYRKDIGKLK